MMNMGQNGMLFPFNSEFELDMLHVALYEPEIPPNTGNIARLCAATRSRLHIVEPAGFRLDDRAAKRAGLDYWEEVDLVRHIDLESLMASLPDSRFVLFSTKGQRSYTEWKYRDEECLVFGPETRGLPDDVLQRYADSVVRIPMQNPNVRSLNLATSVGIALYEAIRQTTAAT